MRVARESSYTTHPGELAAEACAFLAFAVARAIRNPDTPVIARDFLDEVVSE
jgi:ADP-ribosylglycohydrolase